jgi:hypothetical protein
MNLIKIIRKFVVIFIPFKPNSFASQNTRAKINGFG